MSHVFTMTPAFLSSLGWSGAAGFTAQALRFATRLLLARVLSPDDFGLFAAATTILSLAGLLQNLGLQSPLINEKFQGSRDMAYRGAQGLLFAVAIILALALCLAAPVFANLYGMPGLTSLLRVLSFSLVITAFMTVPSAALSRKFRFRELAVAEVLSLLAFAATSMACGRWGWGPYALVCAQLLSQWLYASLLLVFSHRGDHWRFGISSHWSPLRPLFAHGGYSGVNQFLALTLTQGDNAFIGSRAGATMLGYYATAYLLGSAAATVVGGVVGRVLYPQLSQHHDNARAFASSYNLGLQLSLCITLPFTALLVMEPHLIVGALFMDKWAPSAMLLPPLAILGLFRLWNMLACAAVEAEGARGAKATALVKLAQVGLMTLCLPAGYRHAETLGASWAMAAVMASGCCAVALRLAVARKMTPARFLKPFLLPSMATLPCVALATLCATAWPAMIMAVTATIATTAFTLRASQNWK